MTSREVVAIALVVLVHAWSPATADATGGEACEVEPVAGAPSPTLELKAGVETTRVWVTGEYDGLTVRKFTAKGGASVVEFVHGDDKVVLSISRQRVSVGRNGIARDLETPESIEEVQQLLAGSAAMFHSRVMLSQLERTSALKAGSMAILSAAAWAASLTGDVEAPIRLAERFVAKHRGPLMRVRADDEDSCWTAYSKEVDAALTDATNCTREAVETGGLWVLARTYACTAVWVLRAESAWFEYLNCVSPKSIGKLE